MANNLISFYKEGISQPQLNEGVYKCTLIAHKLVDTKPENPYIALEFKTETGRILKENRFDNGFQIFLSHIKQQLDMADRAVNPMELLDELVENETKFNIWVRKYDPAKVGKTGQIRSNFHFLEPRKKAEEDSGVTITEAEEVEDALDAATPKATKKEKKA